MTDYTPTTQAVPTLPATSKQPFCTNCGNSVSEQAIACVSCGARPIGHKKFCRQCGSGLNPDQVVCTQCGANLGVTVILNAKKVMETVSSSVSSRLIKKLVGGGIAIAFVAGLIWFVVPMLSFEGGNMQLNQLKQARSGDWAEYECTVFIPGQRNSEKFEVRTEVLSKSDQRIKIETTITHPYGRVEKEEMEIDLSIKSDEQLFRSIIKENLRKQGAPNGIRDFVDNIKFEVKSGRKTTEMLSTAGQSFRCIVTPLTVSITVGSLTGTVRDIKTWLSSSAPFGLVQAEFRMDVPNFENGRDGQFLVSMHLTAFNKTDGNRPARTLIFGNSLGDAGASREMEVVAVQGQRTAANKRAAFTYIKTLQGLVDRYELDMGRFPTTEQGLAALLAVPSDVHNPADWGGPYISDTATTRDPWGNEYQYVSPGRDGQRPFEIWSFGPDLIDGTEDDITNWGTLGD